MEAADDRTNLYKVKKTVLQMLEDRGYLVSTKDKGESLENFKKNFKSSKELAFVVQRATDPTDTLYVDFSDSPKLGVVDITNFAEILNDQKIKTGIIINKGSITPLAKMVNMLFKIRK
jgi:DNA-directed RNA polymerase I, II, and III subunit RPABC1